MEIRRTTIGEIYYYHPNHLSSSMYVTDAQQSVVQSFLYAPYGEIISEYNTYAMGDAFPKYSFNAKELDEETGFYYYEARYYAPPTFTSRDPLMSEKPWLTPYHYCSNNPVGRVDPSGLTDYDVKTENGTTRKKINDGQNVFRIEVSAKEYNKLERKFNRNQKHYEKYRDKLKDINGYTTGHPEGGIIFTRPKGESDHSWVNDVSFGFNLETALISESARMTYLDNIPLSEAKIAKGFYVMEKATNYIGNTVGILTTGYTVVRALNNDGKISNGELLRISLQAGASIASLFPGIGSLVSLGLSTVDIFWGDSIEKIGSNKKQK